MKVITTSSMVVQGGWLSTSPVPPSTLVSLMRSLDSVPSLCLPQTVRIQTRKVRVATITSQGWVEQNSPWLLKTFLTPLVNILVIWQGSPQPLKHTPLDQTAWAGRGRNGIKIATWNELSNVLVWGVWSGLRESRYYQQTSSCCLQKMVWMCDVWSVMWQIDFTPFCQEKLKAGIHNQFY